MLCPSCRYARPQLLLHCHEKLTPDAPRVSQEQESPGDVEEPVPAEAVPEPSPEPMPEPVTSTTLSSSSFFDADPIEIDEGAVAKDALKAETMAGLAGPRPDKAVMGEILLALEAKNPTPSPATSPLLNGKWKVLYATGASPALKALMLLLKGAKQAPKSPSGADLVDVQDSFVTINADQPRIEASTKVRLLSIESTVTLKSKLEAESAVRLLETYEAAETEWPATLSLPFGSSPLEYKRSVLVSYLDEELLVMRDTAGRPDVLVRVDEPEPEPEPVVAEEPVVDGPVDDSAPGASA